MNKKLTYIKACYYVGVAADLLATIPLVFPPAAALMFGLTDYNPGNDFLYASRIGASLMLGWTLLLLWASFKPIERRGVLLLTVFPVLFGLFVSSILAVVSGYIKVEYMLPLWIFYIIIITAYVVAYVFGSRAGR